MTRAILVDTNILVMLLVGATSRDLIAKFKRTCHYTPADFDLLLAFLDDYDIIVVTPHVLAETSNLVGQLEGRYRESCMLRLASSVLVWREDFVEAAQLVREDTYPRLGLADSALYRGTADTLPLLTDDLHLYLAASGAGRTAINFAHVRAQSWTSDAS